MRLNRREANKEKQEEMISMARRPAARKRPAVNAAPRSAIVQLDKEALTGGGFTALLERVAQEILAVASGVSTPPHWGTYSGAVWFFTRPVDREREEVRFVSVVVDGATAEVLLREGSL